MYVCILVVNITHMIKTIHTDVVVHWAFQFLNMISQWCLVIQVEQVWWSFISMFCY